MEEKLYKLVKGVYTEVQSTEGLRTCANSYCPNLILEERIYCENHAHLLSLPPDQRSPKTSRWRMPSMESSGYGYKLVIEKPSGCVSCGNSNVKLNDFLECVSCVQEHLDVQFSMED
jgi:hypothetical protein